MPLSCPQSSQFSHFGHSPTGLTTALRGTIFACDLHFRPQPFLWLLSETDLVDRNDRTFLSTQSISYRLAIVSLLSYFPSLALPKLASKHMLDTLATRRVLASPTVFPSHYRKNSRFQTSAPVLLKRSLPFTLQLFRKTIPHTQTLMFGVIAASGSGHCRSNPKLGLR